MKYPTKKLYELKENRTFEHLYEAFLDNGDRIAAEYSDKDGIRKMTYPEYKKRVCSFAFQIRKLVGEEHYGRYVGLHLENNPDWPCIFWAILMAGYSPILLDCRGTHKILCHLLDFSEAVAVITNEESLIKPDIMHIRQNDLFPTLVGPDDWKPRWANKIALCTSGTTSTSKVFEFDGFRFVSNMYAGHELTDRSSYLAVDDSKVLMFLPLHHIMGLTIYLWHATCGYTMVFMKDRSPQTILETTRRHKVTHIHCVPLLWNNLASKIIAKVKERSKLKQALFYILCKLGMGIQWLFPKRGQKFVYKVLFRNLHKNLLGPDLVMVLSGGAYLSPKTLKFLTSIGFVVVSGYGMTEIGAVAIDDGESLTRRLRESPGRPFSIVEMKTTSQDGHEVGELWIRGESLSNGEIQKGKLIPIQDEEGWYHTGDLGRIDKKGNIYIIGRCKDTIVTSNGEKVYPDEIEDAFRQLDGVEEYSIFGISSCDSDIVTLVVYVGADTLSQERKQKLTDQIYQINQALPLAKRVQKVFVSRESLPKTTSLKVQRQKLREKLEKEKNLFYNLNLSTKAKVKASPTKAEDCSRDIKERVRIIFSHVLHHPVQSISDEAHFIEELGGDSLAMIELASALQDAFKIEVSDEILMRCTNVKDISEEVMRQLGHKTSSRTSEANIKKTRIPITDFSQSREYKILLDRMSHVNGLNPYFTEHNSVVRDTSFLDGRQVINMGSYNYLGFSGHPDVERAAMEAISMYGTSASGSRLLTGEKALYRELEKEIAQWKDTEDAIVLVSGHATNVTFVGNFCNRNDLILYDILAHNSVEQGCRLSGSPTRAFGHNDFKGLDNILSQSREQYEKVLVVVEGVYSMDGDIAPIPEYVAIKRKYGVFLMVDEAHSSGVLGKSGKGVDEHFGLSPKDIDIRMGTLSKSLGSCGGYIAGEKALVDYLRYSLPGFVFSVGITPSNAAAALASIRLLRDGYPGVARLHHNIRFFMQEALKRNLNTCLAGESAIVPIMVGPDECAFLLSKRMRDEGVFVPPAVYPAVPKGEARLRFCVTSEHKEEQIEKALNTLLSVAKTEGISLPSSRQLSHSVESIKQH